MSGTLQAFGWQLPPSYWGRMCQGRRPFISLGTNLRGLVSPLEVCYPTESCPNNQRLLLDQALKIFYLDIYHRPEAARAHYKKGRVLEKTSQSTIARKELETALDIFNSIVPSEDRVQNIEELEEKNLDRWIMFWSR